jgi:hypothetical protein
VPPRSRMISGHQVWRRSRQQVSGCSWWEAPHQGKIQSGKNLYWNRGSRSAKFGLPYGSKVIRASPAIPFKLILKISIFSIMNKKKTVVQWFPTHFQNNLLWLSNVGSPFRTPNRRNHAPFPDKINSRTPLCVRHITLHGKSREAWCAFVTSGWKWFT